MTVAFSNPIIVPGNYSNFNSSILTIDIHEGSTSNLTITSWKITSFSSTQMTIQLEFSDPTLVSAEVILFSFNLYRRKTR